MRDMCYLIMVLHNSVCINTFYSRLIDYSTMTVYSFRFDHCCTQAHLLGARVQLFIFFNCSMRYRCISLFQTDVYSTARQPLQLPLQMKHSLCVLPTPPFMTSLTRQSSPMALTNTTAPPYVPSHF